MRITIPLTWALSCHLLAGCGAETAGTAVVAGRAQADAALQAEDVKANLQNQLDAAARSEQQRREQAEAAARP
jgi:hypothetical protein